VAEFRPVVWISHREGERCAGCGADVGRGTLIVITAELGVRCLGCAGLADLEYLPSGDTALTRRALALSPRSAVVVELSRARTRHERRGVLVETPAIAAARHACEEDADRRAEARDKSRERADREQAAYVSRFAERIVELFPGCPREDADAIARRACETSSGRVGRSAAARALEARPVELAVRAYVRHRYTPYEDLLAGGLETEAARTRVADAITERLDRWRYRTP
jgi:hypothetical protein